MRLAYNSVRCHGTQTLCYSDGRMNVSTCVRVYVPIRLIHESAISRGCLVVVPILVAVNVIVGSFLLVLNSIFNTEYAT